MPSIVPLIRLSFKMQHHNNMAIDTLFPYVRRIKNWQIYINSQNRKKYIYKKKVNGKGN